MHKGTRLAPGYLERRRLAVVAAAVCAIVAAGAPRAKVYLTKDEALRAAFGADAGIERVTAFLTPDQLDRARRLAGDDVRVESALVTRYVARVGDEVVGTAYFDTHRVRTLQETLMIVVTPEATVGRIEVLAFGEPEEYLPKDAWFEQFPGKRLDRGLTLKRDIHGITGATLSAHAVTEATRRVLAVHRVLADETPERGASATGVSE